MSLGWIEPSIQFLIMLGSLLAALAAWKSARTSSEAAKEARVSREMEQRPLVVVLMERSERGGLDIRIQNVGKHPASDVKVQFREEFLNSSYESVATQPLFRRAIPMIVPGQSLTQLIDVDAAAFFRASGQRQWRYSIAYSDPLTQASFGPDELVLHCGHLEPSTIGLVNVEMFYKEQQ